MAGNSLQTTRSIMTAPGLRVSGAGQAAETPGSSAQEAGSGQPDVKMIRLILCRSHAGDGGWGLYSPGCSDGGCADSYPQLLAFGEADWDRVTERWTRPDAGDYAAAESAFAILQGNVVERATADLSRPKNEPRVSHR
jgi:hypothetical protein